MVKGIIINRDEMKFLSNAFDAIMSLDGDTNLNNYQLQAYHNSISVNAKKDEITIYTKKEKENNVSTINNERD